MDDFVNDFNNTYLSFVFYKTSTVKYLIMLTFVNNVSLSVGTKVVAIKMHLQYEP